jgi:uncharacterized protein (DUF58 family)
MTIDEQGVPSLFLIPLTLVLVGLLLFAALLTGQRELMVLSLILFCVAAGAKFWSLGSLSGIACRAGVDRRRLFPDEKLMLTVTAENGKFLPVLLAVNAAVDGLSFRGSAKTSVAAEAGLLWFQSTRFNFELTALRRGVYRIGPVRIASGDLFGFFPRVRRMVDAVEVVVYPRLVALAPPAVPRRDFFGIPGAESPVQDPVYILGTRDYQNGRPAKHIHWKATARHHKLQEKVFEPSAQEKILLVVDVGPSAGQGAGEPFERMLSAAASSAVRLAGRGCAVGLATNGRMAGEGRAFISVTRNPRQLTALLEALARVRMEPAREIVETLRLHRLPPGISCLCFSLEGDGALQPVRDYFRQRRIPLAVVDGAGFPEGAVAGSPVAAEGRTGTIPPAGEALR